MIYLYVTSALFHVIAGGILVLCALLYFTRPKSGKQMFTEKQDPDFDWKTTEHEKVDSSTPN